MKILNFFRIYGHLKFTQVSKHAEKVIFLIYCSRGEKTWNFFEFFQKKMFFKFLFFYCSLSQNRLNWVKTGQQGGEGWILAGFESWGVF